MFNHLFRFISTAWERVNMLIKAKQRERQPTYTSVALINHAIGYALIVRWLEECRTRNRNPSYWSKPINMCLRLVLANWSAATNVYTNGAQKYSRRHCGLWVVNLQRNQKAERESTRGLITEVALVPKVMCLPGSRSVRLAGADKAVNISYECLLVHRHE